MSDMDLSASTSESSIVRPKSEEADYAFFQIDDIGVRCFCFCLDALVCLTTDSRRMKALTTMTCATTVGNICFKPFQSRSLGRSRSGFVYTHCLMLCWLILVFWFFFFCFFLSCRSCSGVQEAHQQSRYGSFDFVSARAASDARCCCRRFVGSSAARPAAAFQHWCVALRCASARTLSTHALRRH